MDDPPRTVPMVREGDPCPNEPHMIWTREGRIVRVWGCPEHAPSHDPTTPFSWEDA